MADGGSHQQRPTNIFERRVSPEDVHRDGFICKLPNALYSTVYHATPLQASSHKQNKQVRLTLVPSLHTHIWRLEQSQRSHAMSLVSRVKRRGCTLTCAGIRQDKEVVYAKSFPTPRAAFYSLRRPAEDWCAGSAARYRVRSGSLRSGPKAAVARCASQRRIADQ